MPNHFAQLVLLFLESDGLSLIYLDQARPIDGAFISKLIIWHQGHPNITVRMRRRRAIDLL